MRTFILLLSLLSNHAFAMNYSSPSKFVEYSVEIDATLEEVWEYNAQDENAREWSVFFYKIVMCPLKDCPQNATYIPSDIGYTRRSYQNKDESGIYWDETTVKVLKTETYDYKMIRAYNFNGFPPYFKFNKNAEFVVEQFYKKITNNKTMLTFRAGLTKKNEHQLRPNFFNYNAWKLILRFHSGKIIRDVFRKNLINIKTAIEHGDNYARVFQYSPKL